MSKSIYQQSIEPLTFDERVRRLEHQVLELTEKVALLTAAVKAGQAEAAAPSEHRRTDGGRC